MKDLLHELQQLINNEQDYEFRAVERKDDNAVSYHGGKRSGLIQAFLLIKHQYDDEG